MLRPAPLKLNDKVVIISPSGKIDESFAKDAASIMDSWGVKTEIGRYALSENGRFSGSVEERLYDLQSALDNPLIKLILCSRGGYGVIHLLDKLDFSSIRKHPKWVIGYSDITALHSALQKNGIISIHGPMAKHFSEEGEEDLSVRYTKSILFGQPVAYEIPTEGYDIINRKGRAMGKLFGGNLSVFCGLLGSKYIRIPHRGILFIEDIGEVPYRVDRMIYQLKISGMFSKISGLIVGKFTDYEEDDLMYASLYESIRNVVEDYEFPVCFNFPVGHVKHNLPLLMGEKAELIVGDDRILFKQNKGQSFD
ncbi:S66 peptidase family protein [Lascolabacillus massiliensis]|jgi:muramoyltetrapeptide carboxypeptidase|uniref:S66 peptidase family protein n=1 Tax=Lascolabacillus massiliensis TaxID=1627894 RepID=UPI00093BBD9B|nr:LD-carboxypeptidase [Lascolabacillus massiliensis]